MEDQDDDGVLFSDNGVFYGLLMIAALAYLPSFLFGEIYMYIYYVLLGLCGLVGIDELVSAPRKLQIKGSELWIYKGLQNSLVKKDLAQIDFIGMGTTEEEAKNNKISELDLENNTIPDDRWKTVLLHFKDGKKIKLSDYRHNKEKYKKFVARLKESCLELGAGAGSKIQKLRLQNDFYIKKDQNLIRHLNENLADIYASIYKSRDMNTANLSIESILKDANIIFAHKVSDLRVLYFQKDDFLEEIEPESVETAEKLIQTTNQNMLVIKERLKNYVKIQAELEKLQRKQEQRERLERAAQKLDRLQEQNFKGDYLRADTKHETEILKQLESLTEVISKVENLDQATLLEQKIELFKQQIG